MFVHIDCNSFFASCEIATRPELADRPVVVVSNPENNGGIVLALNAKAKAIGLKRGNPLFKIKRLIETSNVAVCTADHHKYHSISAKIMTAVRQQGVVLDFVQYSIDEFFGSLPVNSPDELRLYASRVKDLIFSATAIPVSCGCASTYTLAKVATHFAKHYKAYNGVCVLMPDNRIKALSLLPIGDVWGVGRSNRAHLAQLGVVSALDFSQLDDAVVRKFFNTAAYRTFRELNGIPSISLVNSDTQQSIMQSRTFPYMISDKDALAKEIRTFVNDCCSKLRNQHSVCGSVTLFLNTNRHRSDLPQYSNSAIAKLPVPSSDTSAIMKAALSLLDTIFRLNYQYKRAGVVLTNIHSADGLQLDIFSEKDDARRRRLMQVADEINHRFGSHSIGFGSDK